MKTTMGYFNSIVPNTDYMPIFHAMEINQGVMLVVGRGGGGVGGRGGELSNVNANCMNCDFI